MCKHKFTFYTAGSGNYMFMMTPLHCTVQCVQSLISSPSPENADIILELLPQQSQPLCLSSLSISMEASGHRSLHPRFTEKVASTHLRKHIPSLSY